MRGQFGGGLPSHNSDRTRVMILAGLFFVLLLGAVGIVFLYSSSTKASVKTVVVEKDPEIKLADVLVPIQSIEAGQALEPVMFRKEPRPAVGLPSKTVRDFEEIRGQYAKSLIAAEQPLLRDYLTSSKPTNPITVKIPDGYRAVTISVDERSAVEGWVAPGARVDVIWNSKIRGEAAVTVIVQNALILSAGRQTQDSPTNAAAPKAPPTTVTLLVTAQDAAKIQLAQTAGTLSMNLRGDSDPGKAEANNVGSVTLTDLYPKSGNEPVAPVMKGPKVKMRGKDGQMEEFVFTDGGLVPVKKAAPVAER